LPQSNVSASTTHLHNDLTNLRFGTQDSENIQKSIFVLTGNNRRDRGMS
jgi:hypothetical protein